MSEKYTRPEFLHGYTRGIKTPCGTLYLTLNEDAGKLREVKVTMGKSGTCFNMTLQTIALLFSIMLQEGIDRNRIKAALDHQLDGNCGNKIWVEGVEYHSCVDAIVTFMLAHLDSRGEIRLEEATA